MKFLQYVMHYGLSLSFRKVSEEHWVLLGQAEEEKKEVKISERQKHSNELQWQAITLLSWNGFLFVWVLSLATWLLLLLCASLSISFYHYTLKHCVNTGNLQNHKNCSITLRERGTISAFNNCWSSPSKDFASEGRDVIS